MPCSGNSFLEEMGAATKEMVAAVGSKSNTRSLFPSFDGKKCKSFPEYWDKLQQAMSAEEWQPLVGAIVTTKMSYKEVVDSLHTFESQFPGVQYPTTRK